MTNCRLTDPEFERGVWDFLAVCNVVRTFKHIRILQMSTRPFDFWTTMCNEGELLEKFNIQLAPIPITELIQAVRDAQADDAVMAEMLAYIRENMVVEIPEDKVPEVAGLAAGMKGLIDKYGCNAGAIQCWNALQAELGIMPCAANAILNEMGIPIVCETDIHGAITALLVEAADLGRHRSMFADWTVRHPDNENGELLQHCGPWPCSVACEKPRLTYPLAFDHPGALTAEAQHGELTLCRFDGDNGEYSMLLGRARGIDGPKGMGTYLWVEVDNLKRLETKIVEGPTSTIASPSMPTSCRCYTRRASTSASSRISTTPSRRRFAPTCAVSNGATRSERAGALPQHPIFGSIVAHVPKYASLLFRPNLGHCGNAKASYGALLKGVICGNYRGA